MSKNFEEYLSMDWQEVKIPRMVNFITLILTIFSIAIGHYVVPLNQLLNSITGTPLLILLIPLLILIYIIFHELIHGILMQYFSGISPKYGMSGPFIFAKSEAVFSKSAYILITIAPLLILGTVFMVLSFILSGTWLWLAIFLWVINLYASRGDVQAIVLLKKFPRTYAVKDDGISIHIYKPL